MKFYLNVNKTENGISEIRSFVPCKYAYWPAAVPPQNRDSGVNKTDRIPDDESELHSEPGRNNIHNMPKQFDISNKNESQEKKDIVIVSVNRNQIRLVR